MKSNVLNSLFSADGCIYQSLLITDLVSYLLYIAFCFINNCKIFFFHRLLKTSYQDKRNAKAAPSSSFGLRSDERAEKRKEVSIYFLTPSTCSNLLAICL